MDLLDAIKKNGKLGFCLSAAWLAVMLPPNWSAWLAGDLDNAFLGTFAAAAAGVIRGVLGVAFKALGGQNPFKETTE